MAMQTEQGSLEAAQAEDPSVQWLAEPESNDFIMYASRLWQRRGFIVKAVLAGAVASAILSLVLPKRYESAVRLMPPGGTQTASARLAGALAGPLAETGASFLGIQSPSALYVQVLESRTVQDHLIDKFDLRRVYGTSTYMDARARLAHDTEIADDRKSSVVSVIVTSRSAKLAADLANAYVDELNAQLVEKNTSAAHRERVFLEDHLKGMEDDIQRRTSELSRFTSKNTVIVGEEQSKAVFTAAEALRGQTIGAKADLQALQQAYKPDNERVRAAQARLNELEHELAQMQGSSVSGSSADGFPSIRALPLLGATYTGLYRQLMVEQAVYEALTKQYEMAKVEEARDLPTVRVMDRAEVPEKKSWPKRTLLVAVATLLTFLLSCAFVLCQDWWIGSRSPWRKFAGQIVAESSGFRGSRNIPGREGGLLGRPAEDIPKR